MRRGSGDITITRLLSFWRSYLALALALLSPVVMSVLPLVIISTAPGSLDRADGVGVFIISGHSAGAGAGSVSAGLSAIVTAATIVEVVG